MHSFIGIFRLYRAWKDLGNDDIKIIYNSNRGYYLDERETEELIKLNIVIIK